MLNTNLATMGYNFIVINVQLIAALKYSISFCEATES